VHLKALDADIKSPGHAKAAHYVYGCLASISEAAKIMDAAPMSVRRYAAAGKLGDVYRVEDGAVVLAKSMPPRHVTRFVTLSSIKFFMENHHKAPLGDDLGTFREAIADSPRLVALFDDLFSKPGPLTVPLFLVEARAIGEIYGTLEELGERLGLSVPSLVRRRRADPDNKKNSLPRSVPKTGLSKKRKHVFWTEDAVKAWLRLCEAGDPVIEKRKVGRPRKKEE